MFTLFFPFIIFMKLISHGGVLGNVIGFCSYLVMSSVLWNIKWLSHKKSSMKLGNENFK